MKTGGDRPYLVAIATLSLILLVFVFGFIALIAIGSDSRDADTEQGTSAQEHHHQDISAESQPNNSLFSAEEDMPEQFTPEDGVFPWSDIQVEQNNEMARTNPSVIKILRPGEGQGVLHDNVTNIEFLSALDPANVEQCLMYIGDFLSERDYDPATVTITILEGIETTSEGRYKLFFFQVDGEDAVYSVGLKDPKYCWTVGVNDTGDEAWLRVTTKEYKDVLRRRGYL